MEIEDNAAGTQLGHNKILVRPDMLDYIDRIAHTCMHRHGSVVF